MPDILERPQDATAGSHSGFNRALFRDRARQLGATTDAQAAKLCGISLRTLARMVSGETSPKLATINRIASRLELSLDDLYPSGGRS